MTRKVPVEENIKSTIVAFFYAEAVAIVVVIVIDAVDDKLKWLLWLLSMQDCCFPCCFKCSESELILIFRN